VGVKLGYLVRYQIRENQRVSAAKFVIFSDVKSDSAGGSGLVEEYRVGVCDY
jgi:hypothetical protein